MNRRDRFLIVASLVVTLFCGVYTAKQFHLGFQAPRKPNVLILSLCSFRYKMLSLFSGQPDVVVPAMENFFRHSSYWFSNAFNGMPWTAVFDVAETVFNPWDIASYGYSVRSNNPNGYTFRIPHRESLSRASELPIDDSDFEKNHQAETNFLKFAVPNGPQPFFAVAHYKYMHYPLIDRFNADSEWDFYLSRPERQKIAEYLNHPERYPEKLPFLMMLSNDVRIPLVHPRVKTMGNLSDPFVQRKVKGLLTDPQLLRDWQASAEFESDLDLLEKAYKGNARYLDKVLEPILNLWGDEDLKRNTIVILTGDHGEMHMEHGDLTHGHFLFDEGLKVPMAIRFPGHEQAIEVKSQMQFRMLATLVQGVMRGMVDAGNFLESLKRIQEDTLLLRDCVNTKRGLRFKNQYKYLYDIAEDQPHLFDLVADPGETHDVASEHPELVDRFEKTFWELYPLQTEVDPGGCFTWAVTDEG